MWNITYYVYINFVLNQYTI